MSIPQELYSETTGNPFETCSVCNKSLHDDLYFIEKAYHRNLGDDAHTVIFEYAICAFCKQYMLQQVSAESMQRMQAFMLDHQGDLDEMMAHTGDLDHCSFTQTPIHEMDEYHVVGVVKNGETQMNPLIFGPKIMESYQEMLSEKTKGFFDDFYDDFIDVPPELARILSGKVKPVMF